MEHSHRYHTYPTQEVAEGLQCHLNVHRQLYDHVRWDYTNSPEDDKPSEYDQNNKLPEWKLDILPALKGGAFSSHSRKNPLPPTDSRPCHD